MEKKLFADRFKIAVSESGVADTQEALGRLLGVSPVMIWSYRSGEKMPRMSTAARMAEALGVNVNWLLTGQGSMKPEPLTPENWLKDIEFENNVGPGPKLRKPIPLISWVKAGDLCEAEDPYQPGDADEWLDCPFDHSPSAFCLRVVGDSMMPEYREGEVILVDPALCANHGDDVIVRTPEGKATFKRLHDTPDGKYLIAINPAHPDRIIKVPEGTHICGVVTGSWMQRRR
jgi:SOS-response transcriptional repressor LexA